MLVVNSIFRIPRCCLDTRIWFPFALVLSHARKRLAPQNNSLIRVTRRVISCGQLVAWGFMLACYLVGEKRSVTAAPATQHLPAQNPQYTRLTRPQETLPPQPFQALISLSFQSSSHLSFTLLVRYRSLGAYLALKGDYLSRIFGHHSQGTRLIRLHDRIYTILTPAVSGSNGAVTLYGCCCSKRNLTQRVKRSITVRSTLQRLCACCPETTRLNANLSTKSFSLFNRLY